MKLFSKKFIHYRLPVIALCIAIFWQSSHPSLLRELWFPHCDKLLHFILYAALSFLSVRGLSVEKFSPALVRTLAIGFSILYGLSDEIHQSFVPGRDASILDLMADAVGSFVGALSYPAPVLQNRRPLTKSK